MEKKNVVFLTVLAIATLLTAVVGTTFAYFTATVAGNEGAQATTVTTAQDLGVTYSDGDAIGLTNAIPGAYTTTAKRITVHNDSQATTLEYEILWDTVSNNFVQGLNGSTNTDDLVYSLVKVTGESPSETRTNQVSGNDYLATTVAYDATNSPVGAMVTGKAYSGANHTATITANLDSTTNEGEIIVGKVPANGSTTSVLATGSLAGGATDTYELRVYYLETGVNQNTNQSTAGSGTCANYEGATVPTTQAACTAANGEWTATVAAKTVTFSAKLKTVLVNDARVTYTPAQP